ncbi:MAG: leucine-rich repeat domain-containing protein, partial [Verrucomicrobiaceae bacterium]
GSSLERATFASGTVALPDSIFYGCDKLKEVVIPATVKRIGERAFYNCRGLPELTLPAALEEIAPKAFVNCARLRNIEIPSSVTVIGDNAFKNSGIRQISLPKGTKSLGEGAFFGCVNLVRADLPPSLKQIPSFLFAGCKRLNSVFIPAGVSAIGQEAFVGCDFTSVTFPDKLRKIGSGAFMNCSDLSTAVFTGKAPLMGNRVFARTAADFTIFLEENATGFTLPRWRGYRTTPPRPEISIQRSDETDLQNGNTSQLPSALIGGKASYASIIIRNTGIRPLTELRVSIQGEHTSDFTATDLKAQSIAPGKATVVKVRFAPTQGGKRRAQLNIRSNDNNEDPSIINLAATGLRKN